MVGRLVLFVVVLGLVGLWWEWIVGGVVVGLLVWAGVVASRRARVELAERAARRREISVRADRQHHWFITGDPRWIHGTYPPAC